MEAYALVTAFDAEGQRVSTPSTLLVPASTVVHYGGVNVARILVTSVKITCEPDRRADATTYIFVRSHISFYDAASPSSVVMPAGCVGVHAPGFQPRERIVMYQPSDTLVQPRFNCVGTDDVDVRNGWGLLGDAEAFGDGDVAYLSVVINNYVARALWIGKVEAAKSPWQNLSDADRRCIAAWTLQGAGVLYCDGGKQTDDTRGLPDETFGIRKDCDGVAAAGACLFAALKKYHRELTYASSPLGAMAKSVVGYLMTAFSQAGVAFVVAVSPGSQAKNHTSRAIHECEMHHKCVKPFGHAVLVLMGSAPMVVEMTAPVAPMGTTKNDLTSVFVMGDAEYNDAASGFRKVLHKRGYTHGSFYRGREWQPYFYKELNVIYTAHNMWVGKERMDGSADDLYKTMARIRLPDLKLQPSFNHAYRRVPAGTVPARMAPTVLRTLPEIPISPDVVFAVQISKTEPRAGTDIDALNRIITTEPFARR